LLQEYNADANPNDGNSQQIGDFKWMNEIVDSGTPKEIDGPHSGTRMCII
jgi:hypothetical protein